MINLISSLKSPGKSFPGLFFGKIIRQGLCKFTCMNKTWGFWLIIFVFLGHAGEAQVCGTPLSRAHILKTHPDWLYLNEGFEKTEDFVDPSGVFVIPIVFHVVYPGDSFLYLVPDSQVHSQVRILNETYGRYEGGANTDSLGANSRIQFCLASRDPEGNPSTGITHSNSFRYYNFSYPAEEDSLKKFIAPFWDSRYYLNVWVVGSIVADNSGIEGYAYYPTDAATTYLDGVVLANDKLGEGGYGIAEPESHGRTLAHEAGHYLNLYHTWGDSSNCNGSDFVTDTPPCSGPYFYCTERIQCDTYFRQIQNYMDYTPDSCQNLFTMGQIQRMRKTIFALRPALVSVENLVRTGCESALDSFAVGGEFVIYPNPSTTGSIVVSIQFGDQNPTEIKIYDEFGRFVSPIKNVSQDRGAVVFDFRGYRSGLYVFQLMHEGKLWVRRVLIQNE